MGYPARLPSSSTAACGATPARLPFPPGQHGGVDCELKLRQLELIEVGRYAQSDHGAETDDLLLRRGETLSRCGQVPARIASTHFSATPHSRGAALEGEVARHRVARPERTAVLISVRSASSGVARTTVSSAGTRSRRALAPGPRRHRAGRGVMLPTRRFRMPIRLRGLASHWFNISQRMIARADPKHFSSGPLRSHVCARVPDRTCQAALAHSIRCATTGTSAT